MALPSEWSDFVTIVVKAGDGLPSSSSSRPHLEEPSPSPSSSSSRRFGDGRRGCVGVPRAWLAMLPWFEAKLERWQKEGDPPEVVLQIPDDCNAVEGARLLRFRLYVHFAHTPSMVGRDVAKDGPLNEELTPLGWWRETGGSTKSLMSALHIFHMTLLENFAKEVAETLSQYRLRSPKSAVIIGTELRKDLAEDLTSFPTIFVSVEKLREMVQDTCSLELRQNVPRVTEREIAERVAGLQLWATRAILGSAFRVPDRSIQMLVEAWFNCYVLELPVRRIRQAANSTPQEAKIGVEKPQSASRWLTKRLEDLVHQNPDWFKIILEEVRSRLPLKQTVMKVEHLDREGEVVEEIEVPVKVDTALPMSVCQTLRNCMNIMFVQSSRVLELVRRIESILKQSVGLMYPLLIFRSSEGAPLFRFPMLACDVLAISPASVQRAFLEQLPPKFFMLLQTKVHHIHEEARHLFVGKASYLATSDITFLSTAHIPEESSWTVLPNSEIEMGLPDPSLLGYCTRVVDRELFENSPVSKKART